MDNTASLSLDSHHLTLYMIKMQAMGDFTVRVWPQAAALAYH